MLVLCVARGFDDAWVRDLPWPNFVALTKSVKRVMYQQKVEDTYATLYATQAAPKDVKAFIDQQFMPQTQEKPKAKNDAEALARDLFGQR